MNKLNIINIINLLPSDVFVELMDNYCRVKKLKIAQVTVDDIIAVADRLGGHEKLIENLKKLG